MNWSRYKLLIVSGVVCLLLAGGAVFLLMKSSSANHSMNTEIQQLQNQRAALVSKQDFPPSQETLEALKEEQQTKRDLRDALMTTIQKGQLEPRRMIRSRFGEFVRVDLVPGLQSAAKAATRGGEQGVLLEDPRFGLAAYLEEGALPEPGEIPGLMLELDTMDYLCRQLFDAGISELVAVEVSQAEKANDAKTTPLGGGFGDLPGVQPGALPGVARGLQGPGQRNPNDQVAPEEGTPDWLAERDRLFEPVNVTLRFKVYEDYLWGLLSRMMADPNQIVITSIRITNDNRALWPSSIHSPFDTGTPRHRGAPGAPITRRPQPARNDIAAMFAGMETGDPGAREAEENSTVPIAGLKERRERTTGGEMLNVHLTLKLYRLKPQAAEPTTAREGM